MKHFYILFITLFSLNLSAQTCDGRYQSEIFTNVEVTTVDYGSANGQTLRMDIYQAQGDTATDRPIVIFCFGGAFVSGTRTSPDMVGFASAFAKRGYVCASIDYRLASFFDLLSEEGAIKTVFRSVQDGKAAIRYFRKDARNGNALGVDSNQIFIGGTSAGGILGINLAYADDTSELPANQKVWLEEIGGMEGNSGNSGYCSKPSGVFGFAGAVADTSYIDSTDVPFYGCHSTGDQVVLYNFGPPVNPAFPANLYGSGPIETRMNNLGIYNVLDTYSGTDHPPLSNGNDSITLDNLTDFFYNILDCNSNNFKLPNQKTCYPLIQPADTSALDTAVIVNPPVIDTTNVSIFNLQAENVVKVYPNPTENILNLKSELNIDAIQIIDVLGRLVFSETLNTRKEAQINVSSFENGIFYLKINIDGNWFTEKVYIK